MFLENLVFDAVEPRSLGRFWEAVVGGERLTDEPAGYETRLAIEGGPVLDLCFQRVAALPHEPSRLHLGLAAGSDPAGEVDRLLALGARHLDPVRSDLPGHVLADPEGGSTWVVDPAAYADTGPVAVLLLDSAEPDRDAAFWSWLTGWTEEDGRAARALRHPSGRGPMLELRPEREAKGPGKNRLHLDVRLERGDDPDEVAAGIVEGGGRELRPDWGDLPWRIFTDPSGNELCVLPARS